MSHGIILSFIIILSSSLHGDVKNSYISTNFIVLFRNYLSSYRRRTILIKILAPTFLSYSILSRNYEQQFNSTTSDFDVIQTYNLSTGVQLDFIERFHGHHFVKGVHLERIFHRDLRSQSPAKHIDLPLNSKQGALLLNLWNPEFAAGAVPLSKVKQPWLLLSAQEVWQYGLCGEGVRVGIFDTGLVNTNMHKHFRETTVKERTDWTQKKSQNRKKNPNRKSSSDEYSFAIDGHGHGTFVASLLTATPDSSVLQWAQESTQSKAKHGLPPPLEVCPPSGLAPRAELYIFKVFTDTQISMTSWFLDAFNYAIARRLHIISLSIGGPDFLDQPFVDKVMELSANGILMVSAIGNDGPFYGTLNNPADQLDVLGVGGLDAAGNTAEFSSRGATAKELSYGYGRFKPDISTWATGVIGSSLTGDCTSLSGTSVATPVVTGVVALLISAALSRYPIIDDKDFLNLHHIQSSIQCSNCPPINPASLKQAIIAGAEPIVNNSSEQYMLATTTNRSSPQISSAFEQGAGMINLLRSVDIMQRIKPQASLWPSYVDFTNCPYMWPYCSQPIYSSALPIIINVTIINSMSVHGRVVGRPVYHPYLTKNGHWLDVGVTYSRELWPWVGYISLHLTVSDIKNASKLSGTAEGWISLKVESDDLSSPGRKLTTELKLPIRVNIVPRPNRRKIILWDHFHNIGYPSAYVPRDDLALTDETLDWMGDHIHTNFRDLYQHLRTNGYFIEVLQSRFTCFDARNYGTLMIVDPEDEFSPEEIDKLESDVIWHGLSVIAFGGWHNTTVQSTFDFYDENTHRHWSPVVGGSNIPALNKLLHPFGIQFGDTIISAEFIIGNNTLFYGSGANLVSFPTHYFPGDLEGIGHIFSHSMVDIGADIIRRRAAISRSQQSNFITRQEFLMSNLRRNAIPLSDSEFAIMGLWMPASNLSGKIIASGDSNCLDSVHLTKNCFWLVDDLLKFIASGKIPYSLSEAFRKAENVSVAENFSPPNQPTNSNQNLSPTIKKALRSTVFPECFRVMRALVAPTNLDRMTLYAPQSLILYPPLNPPPRSFRNASIPWCHSRSTNAPASFDLIHRPSYRFLLSSFLPKSTLLGEYFIFYFLSSLIIIFLLKKYLTLFFSYFKIFCRLFWIYILRFVIKFREFCE